MPSPLDEPEQPTPPSHTPRPGEETTTAPARVLAIEAAPSHPSAADEEVHVLDVGEGNVVKLDKLGPMIINSDGTLSRIQNWQDLHPIEQERTVRLLVKKRNLVRLAKLDAEDAGSGSEEKLSALQDAGKKDTTFP